jgi:trehalose synthase
MHRLDDYRKIVGDKVISEITRLARPLYGLRVLHINSTYYGGGVAEMLYSMVPLLNDIGIEADWRILRGTPEFFGITKKFHNAIQGDDINLTDVKKRVYLENNQDFASYCKIDYDCVMIHDPQPLPLIKYYKKRQPWLWRCHVDLSHPNQDLWEFLKGYILRYDTVVVSHEKYMKEDLPVDHRVIHPVIDPLSSKNMDLPESLVNKTLRKHGVSTDKPLVTQISRFDKWKDPVNVVEAFKLARKHVDCRLILCGSMATDDPEGWEIYEEVRKKANTLIEKGDVLLITAEDNILVNALQRVSTVILQKSIREGFGLTVTEALWKETPVIATNVGGIPLQMKDGVTGYLIDPMDIEGCSKRIVEILKNSGKGKEMGKQGKQFVKWNFLITRHLLDDLRLLNDILEQRLIDPRVRR